VKVILTFGRPPHLVTLGSYIFRCVACLSAHSKLSKYHFPAKIHKRFNRRVRFLFCAPSGLILERLAMSQKVTVTKEQIAKAARNYQRRAQDRRESLAETARKTGVSVGVFKRALQNPSKTLKKEAEATRIRTADPEKSAAAINKDVKHHSYRSVQRERQSVRKKRLDRARVCVIVSKKNVGEGG
jgi:Sec-independent protein translocase protein TatA